jgi:hypothetical protein
VRLTILLVLFLSSCSSGEDADLQYIKEARSIAAEWALINEQASAGKLTETYVQSMRQWLQDDLRTVNGSLANPRSPYGDQIRQLLAEPSDAAPAGLRAHAQVLKHIEDGLESA